MHMGSWGRYGQKTKLSQVIKNFENYTKEFVCSSIDSENVLAICSFYQYIMKEKNSNTASYKTGKATFKKNHWPSSYENSQQIRSTTDFNFSESLDFLSYKVLLSCFQRSKA